MKIACDKRDLCLPPECGHELTSGFSIEAADSDHAFCHNSYHDSVEPGAGRNWYTDDCGVISPQTTPCQIIFGIQTCAKNTEDECETCLLRGQTVCGDPPESTIVNADCSREESYCNVEQTCEATCPDGTRFSYTVAAGTFCEDNQTLANEEAYSFACYMAQQKVLCITPIVVCCCTGDSISSSIGIYGTNADTARIVGISGDLPPGVSFSGNTISGTPTALGTYLFNIIVQDSLGNIAIQSGKISVLEITSADTLSDYTIGQAYSYQLIAEGGSGNYSWAIISGALPDGLTLATDGLISGTPTGTDSGTMPIVFSVVDLTCEAAQRSKFPPKVTLTTTSHTTVRTKRGWTDYTGDDYGTLYKTLTPTGWMYQIAGAIDEDWTYPGYLPTLPFCGGARYDYSGYSQIDVYGNLISQHRKDLTVACTRYPVPNVTGAYWNGSSYSPYGTLFNVTTLEGYCWPADPASCSTCSDNQATWNWYQDRGMPSQWDYPRNIVMDQYSLVNPDAATLTYNHLLNVAGILWRPGTGGNPPTYPVNFPRHLLWPINQGLAWAGIYSTGNWTIALSNPYTDADAESSKVVYSSNGKTTANRPFYRVWHDNFLTHRSSMETTVDYTLRCINLVVGQDYVATVQLVDNSGTRTTLTFPFTALAPTHDINGSLGTPAANTTVTVKNPSLTFAP